MTEINYRSKKTTEEIKKKIREGCEKLAAEARKNPPAKTDPGLEFQKLVDLLNLPLFNSLPQ